jgi:hypothetical protein
MRKIRLILLTVLVIAPLFFLLSCGGGGGSPSEDLHERVRFVNALIGYDNIEASLGSEDPVQVTVNYGNDSGYFAAPEGDSVPVRIRKSGSVLPSISATLSIEAGKSYSYYVLKNKGEVVGNLVEDTDVLTDNTIVNARIFNAAVSDEPIDFYITFTGQSINGEEPVIAGAAFNTATDAVEFNAGTYRLSVTREGGESVIASLPEVDFTGGITYTIVVLESQEGGSPYSLLVLEHLD